ncbi:hypothetical protein, partial [Aldersonia kunmingensis]|uniref:hypothetical protein n=1 Tax=Aldersonia kunmingensis TaxID=408066 RepID=UPI001C9E40EB
DGGAELPRLRVTRLTEPQLIRTICLAHRANLAPSHAAVAFQAMLKDSVDATAAETAMGLSVEHPRLMNSPSEYARKMNHHCRAARGTPGSGRSGATR